MANFPEIPWPHVTDCTVAFPLLQVNNNMGRNTNMANDKLQANEDIEPSGLVHQMNPVVCGPGRGKIPVCLGCLQQVHYL